jgi:predicted AlkP superfamily pyrophosphatase or phosphodiesterase
VLTLIVSWLFGGCAAMPDERRATFGIPFPPLAAAEKPSAIVFMVDGVNADVFRELLDGGRLPNLRKYLVDRGLYVERAVASVPGVTLPNQVSLVTGVFPGRHGITGISWFDRNALIERDYEEVAEKNLVDMDYRTTTIFERLPDATAMSLFFQAHRGVSKFVENWTSAGPPYFMGWYGFVDRLALWRFDIVAQIARAQGEFPALVYAYLLAPDMEAYRNGVSSAAYRGAMEHADAHVGRILRDLEAAGRLDRTVIALVSDHGMVDVTHHWPIRQFFRDELHLAVPGEAPWETTRFEDRLAYFDRYHCVLEGSGDRYWAVYLRKPRAVDARGAAPAFQNWLARPTAEDLRRYPSRDGQPIDLVDRLLAADAVDLVAYRAAPGVVHLVSRRGTAEVTRTPAADGNRVGDRYALRILRGNDPLGYGETVPTEMLGGRAFDSRAWLDATHATDFPDLVPQILAYFDAPRAGDLVVFAAPGWDFRHEYKGGHGGVRAAEMHTVLLLAGPGVPHERRPGPARTLDLVPTLLELLGRSVPGDLDGQSVLRREPK